MALVLNNILELKALSGNDRMNIQNKAVTLNNLQPDLNNSKPQVHLNDSEPFNPHNYGGLCSVYGYEQTVQCCVQC